MAITPIKTRFLSRAKVAELFGVSPNTVTRWAREKKLPSIRTPGGQHRFPREAVERLLRELSTAA